MSDLKLILSPKFKAFLKNDAELETLEGSTAAGKTTVGIYKFILKVWQSDKKLHIIAGDDTGTVEKNLINKDLGILDDFDDLVEYKGNGSKEYKMPHVILHKKNDDKIIFVVGYSTKEKWKDALGGQYGCLLIDEANTANIEFVREAIMRADYTMLTLNPDDPTLPIYNEYINRCRPIEKWTKETPQEILNDLKEPVHEKWVHWFFNFDDNYGLTEEKKNQIIESVPIGTKIWKNKIKGLRGKAVGLVFSNFDRKINVLSFNELIKKIGDKKNMHSYFDTFTIGVDTAYSQKSADTIAMIFQGITTDGTLITLDEEVYNNADLQIPIAPSDTVKRLIDFADRNKEKWGFAKYIFLDSADQATITEWKKYKRLNGSVYDVVPAYKKTKIIDRINLQLGWIAKIKYLVLEHCKNHIHELETYAWKENKYEPEDKNDHTINANQYAWLPFKQKIGVERKEFKDEF